MSVHGVNLMQNRSAHNTANVHTNQALLWQRKHILFTCRKFRQQLKFPIKAPVRFGGSAQRLASVDSLACGVCTVGSPVKSKSQRLLLSLQGHFLLSSVWCMKAGHYRGSQIQEVVFHVFRRHFVRSRLVYESLRSSLLQYDEYNMVCLNWNQIRTFKKCAAPEKVTRWVFINVSWFPVVT